MAAPRSAATSTGTRGTLVGAIHNRSQWDGGVDARKHDARPPNRAHSRNRWSGTVRELAIARQRGPSAPAVPRHKSQGLGQLRVSEPGAQVQASRFPTNADPGLSPPAHQGRPTALAQHRGNLRTTALSRGQSPARSHVAGRHRHAQTAGRPQQNPRHSQK